MVSYADYLAVISKYSCYIVSPPLLTLNTDPSTGVTRVNINLELRSHAVYGTTKFRIREEYDSSGNQLLYRYCWEVNNKPTGHISAWENEHDHGFPSDPHHHHHVPFDRKQVQASPYVRTLEEAFSIVIPYIDSGRPYP